MREHLWEALMFTSQVVVFTALTLADMHWIVRICTGIAAVVNLVAAVEFFRLWRWTR